MFVTLKVCQGDNHGGAAVVVPSVLNQTDLTLLEFSLGTYLILDDCLEVIGSEKSRNHGMVINNRGYFPAERQSIFLKILFVTLSFCQGDNHYGVGSIGSGGGGSGGDGGCGGGACVVDSCDGGGISVVGTLGGVVGSGGSISGAGYGHIRIQSG